MLFLATKLIKFPWVTYFGATLRTFAPFVQHLRRTTSGAEEMPPLGVGCVNEMTFSCTSEAIREHLSDQTSPFVLFPQVFLIKNVISLINCLIAPAAAPIVCKVLSALWFSQGAEGERKMGLSPPFCLHEMPFFRLCIRLRTWLYGNLLRLPGFTASGQLSSSIPLRYWTVLLASGDSSSGWKAAFGGLCPSDLFFFVRKCLI